MECSAWDLMGTHYELWASGKYKIRIVGGRAFYTDAYNTKRDNICLSKIDQDLHIVRRWVKADALVELIPD